MVCLRYRQAGAREGQAVLASVCNCNTCVMLLPSCVHAFPRWLQGGWDDESPVEHICKSWLVSRRNAGRQVSVHRKNSCALRTALWQMKNQAIRRGVQPNAKRISLCMHKIDS